jgi:hypothetical protein
MVASPIKYATSLQLRLAEEVGAAGGVMVDASSVGVLVSVALGAASVACNAAFWVESAFSVDCMDASSGSGVGVGAWQPVKARIAINESKAMCFNLYLPAA